MAHYVYDNKVLANKYNSILTTEVNLNQFITLDNTLTQGAGDTKRIIFRSVTGSVDEVAMGQGNTHSIEVTGYYKDYVLKTTQAYGKYFDEEAQRDPLVVDTMLKGMSEQMLENWNGKVMAAFGEATYNEVAGNINFDGFVDCLAKFKEKQDGLFALISPKSLAVLRKALKDDLKYSEAFVRTGYIGSVCSIPIYMSQQVPEGEVIIANREAVTAFINKNTEMENRRDPDTRKNEYWARTVALIALTDEKKVCRLAAAATTVTTITTKAKGAKVVAGAGDGEVKVYINGELKKTGTASGHAYSITLDDNLVDGDKIDVVCREEGHVSSKASATAA